MGNMWGSSYDECGVYTCADDYDDAQRRKAQGNNYPEIGDNQYEDD